MRQKLLLLSTLTFVFFSVFGCDKPEIKVSGYVKSVDTYEGISAAKIVLGDKSTSTDDKGYYTLTVSEEYREEILKITADNFIPFQSSPEVSSGKEIVLETFLKPLDKTETVDPAVENVITSLDGAEVKLPVLNGVTEKLVVSVTNFHVATDDIQTISGDFSAIDASGAETNIYSSGMIDVQIKGADTGDNYSLEGKGTYTIKIPVTANKDTTPATIPLWYFDTDKNKWVEQGQATLDPTRTFYEGTVTHFSTWNADQKMDATTAVSGTIVDPSPAAGETYQITLTFDGFNRTFSQSESDLDFTIINLPQNQEMSLQVKKMSTGEVWLKTIPPVTGATYNAGNFPDADYVSEVLYLKVKKTKEEFTLSWTDPLQADFEKVQVAYCPTLDCKDSTTITVDILKGVETRTFPGLPSQEYTVTITALYSDGKKSKGLTKNIYVQPIPTATLTFLVEDDWFYNFVLVDGVKYTGPIDYPIIENVPPITVTLEAPLINSEVDLVLDAWEGDGIDDSNKYTNPLEVVMDRDKTILVKYKYVED